jgi:hypothetical protein
MLSLMLTPDEFLMIRRGAKVVVSAQFFSQGAIVIGDPNDSATVTAELNLGPEEGIGGAGVNGGIISVLPTATSSSPALNNRLYELVNQGSILISRSGETGGVLNNFGRLINQSFITNQGFLHNSGPPVQSQPAQLIQTVESARLFSEGGIIENFGQIRGHVVGDCPGDCS